MKSYRSPSPSPKRVAVAAMAAGLMAARGASAQAAQPKPNEFVVAGSTGVSAQQLFLGTDSTVYIVDKVENNPAQVNGHAAWAAEYDLRDGSFRAMDVRTNSFCAAGAVLGDGRWINVGGNKPVTTGGKEATDGQGPYDTVDGRNSTRILTPCDNKECEWSDDEANYMTSQRWYPTVETLQDGSAIIIGGDTLGGFVNGRDQNNPTVEFFPHKKPDEEPIFLPILNTTLPANLYSLTWLLPSGKLFIQTNQATELYDWNTGEETPLPDIPHAIRTYPASGATAMLPLTPKNNYTATVMFCGGQQLQDNSYWYMPTSYWLNKQADSTCVKMSPDVSQEWEDDDPLPEGRSMGNLIALPDGRFFLTNGINMGVAGYNDTAGTPYGGIPYGDKPIMAPVIYDPAASAGKRWTREGLGNLNFGRYYHSSATLLPDGSVFVAGSNPFADFVAEGTDGMPTYSQVTSEIFYPDYFSKTKPNPQGVPKTLSYGGDYFNITLGKDDAKNLDNTRVVVIRPGFSTHAINFGQRFLELNSTYSKDGDGATLHVSQMPPNAATFAPGTAMVFVVVDGVPSNATFVMVGNGKIGEQPISPAADLPAGDGTSTTSDPSAASGSGGGSSGASGLRLGFGAVATGLFAVAAAMVVGF